MCSNLFQGFNYILRTLDVRVYKGDTNISLSVCYRTKKVKGVVVPLGDVLGYTV